jgi:hypothetical protein
MGRKRKPLTYRPRTLLGGPVPRSKDTVSWTGLQENWTDSTPTLAQLDTLHSLGWTWGISSKGEAATILRGILWRQNFERRYPDYHGMRVSEFEY